MKLVRQIPSHARQIASGMSIYRDNLFYYIADGKKYIRIVTPMRTYCYEGHDLF